MASPSLARVPGVGESPAGGSATGGIDTISKAFIINALYGIRMSEVNRADRSRLSLAERSRLEREQRESSIGEGQGASNGTKVHACKSLSHKA